MNKETFQPTRSPDGRLNPRITTLGDLAESLSGPFFLSSFRGYRESQGSCEGEGSSMTPTKRQVCDTLSLNLARPEPMPLTRHELCVSWAPPHLRHESSCGGNTGWQRHDALCPHPPFGRPLGHDTSRRMSPCRPLTCVVEARGAGQRVCGP
jgi:hypothetical protein